MDTPIDYDDIIFLPHELYQPKTLNHEMRRAYRNERLKKIIPRSWTLDWQHEAEEKHLAHHRVSGTLMRNTSFLNELRAEYAGFRRQMHAEPSWINTLPKKIRGDIRRYWHAVEYEDPECIVPFMPFSDVRYLVREGGICTHAIRSCALYRLGHIRQLGNLHDPIVFEEGFAALGQRFGHTRYQHVHDVSALITLMGLNNGIEHRLLSHLRISALIHDGLTPAHGDGTKAIDPERFDEDAFIAALLTGAEWEEFRDRYGISKSLLVDIVQHRHNLGVMLDYADRIAYVSRDLEAYLMRYHKYLRVNKSRDYQMLLEIVKRDPQVCSLWDTIRLDASGAVYCDNPEKLEQFLRVRILMFRALYYNPHARFMEYFVSRAITGVLYKKGLLTHEALLRMGDFELDGIIGNVLNDPYTMAFPSDFGEAHLKRFANREEAACFEADLKRQGIIITLLDDVDRKIRSGTKYRVKNARGDIAAFHTLYSHQAAALERLCIIPNPFAVYWIENNAVTERVQGLLEDPVAP
ncbi:MAG: hypothetical protein AAB400_02185 [Patescibacteria group bacterium]|mgnify:CR=1 FL=1